MALTQDIYRFVIDQVARSSKQLVMVGTVTDTSPLSVLVDGSGVSIPMLALDSYALAAGDRVMALQAGTSWVVQGRLTSSPFERNQRRLGRVQQALTLCGIPTITSTSVAWTGRIIALGIGHDDLSPSGFFDIRQPAVGTVIPGHGGAAAQTVSAAGIAMIGWVNLYYEIPLAGVSTSQDGNFHLVSYNQAFTVPDTWVLVAVRDSDDSTIRIADRAPDTGWVTTGFSAATNWTLGACATRRSGESIEVVGAVVRTTSALTATTVGNVGDTDVLTIPTAFRPSRYTRRTSMRADFTGGTVDVGTNGVVTLADMHSGSTISVGDSLNFSLSYLRN